MKLKFLSTIILITLLSKISFAQRLLTFEDAIAIALKNNHQIQIARNTAEISQNSINIGNADLLPKIDVMSSANYQDREIQSSTGESNEALTLTNAQVQASYTLFAGFSNIYRFKRLKLSGEIGNLQARNQIENTLYYVSNAYYTVARSSENFKIARELLAISKERLERAEKRSAFGQANTIDVLAAQVDLNADSITATNSKLLLDESKRNLNILLNREVNLEFNINPEVDFLQLLTLNQLIDNAMNNNAAYMLAENQLKQSRIDYRLSQSAFSPKIDLQSSYNYNQTNSELNVNMDNPNRVFSAGVTLSFNLFNGFKNNIQMQNAKLSLENQQLYRNEIKLELEKLVISTYESYKNSKLVLALEKENLQAAELNFKRTQELYNLGRVTTTQFREAQLNLIRAKNNISNAQYNAKLDEIELMRLSGQLIKNTDE